MKIKTFFMLLAMTSMIAFQSCKDDEPDIDQYIGSYNVSEVCNGSPDDYVITITAGTESDEIIISNFYNVGVTVTAQVEGDLITYLYTESYASYTISYTGTGEIDDDTIELNWEINVDGTTEETCSATCTRI